MGGSDIRIKIPVQVFFHNCIAAGNRHVRAFRKACPVCGQEFGGHYRSPAESVFKASQDFPRRPRNLLRLYLTHCICKSTSNLLSRLRGGGNPAGYFHYASLPCPCHAPREIIPPRGLRWRPHPSGTPPPWTIRPRRRTGGAVWIFPRTGFVFRRANGKFQPRLRPPASILMPPKVRSFRAPAAGSLHTLYLKDFAASSGVSNMSKILYALVISKTSLGFG